MYSATNGQVSKSKSASRERRRSPPPPAPRVVVDTGSPLKSHKVKNHTVSEPAPKGQRHSPPPPAPKVVVDAGSPVKSTRFKNQEMKKPFIPKIDVAMETDRPAERPRRKDVAAEKRNGHQRKTVDHMHEFVQTDIDRGHTDSGQEAQVSLFLTAVSMFLLSFLP